MMRFRVLLLFDRLHSFKTAAHVTSSCHVRILLRVSEEYQELLGRIVRFASGHAYDMLHLRLIILLNLLRATRSTY